MTSELKTAIIGWLLWLDAEDAQEGKSGSCEMLVAPMSDDDFQFFFWRVDEPESSETM